MPFGNGDIARVTLSLYKAPKGQSRPIDAYVVTECEGDFTGAARRAAEAVYNLAQKQLPRIEQMVIGLDVQGLSPGSSPVTGESCGLTFAVAIAGELFKKNQPIAATGVVSSSVNGKIDRVDGIAKKLLAAAEAIPTKGRILYPTDNHNDIPEEVFKLARDKRITLHPVSSIAEAIYAAYGIEVEDNQTNDRSRLKKISAVLIILLATIVLGTSLFMNKGRQKVLSPVQSIPADETVVNIVAVTPVVTPSPVKEADKKNIAVNIDPPPQEPQVSEKTPKQPALTTFRAEEELDPKPSSPSKKPLNQHAKNTPQPEEELDTPPAPASSEPFYPDTGFE